MCCFKIVSRSDSLRALRALILQVIGLPLASPNSTEPRCARPLRGAASSSPAPSPREAEVTTETPHSDAHPAEGNRRTARSRRATKRMNDFLDASISAEVDRDPDYDLDADDGMYDSRSCHRSALSSEEEGLSDGPRWAAQSRAHRHGAFNP